MFVLDIYHNFEMINWMNVAYLATGQQTGSEAARQACGMQQVDNAMPQCHNTFLEIN